MNSTCIVTIATIKVVNKLYGWMWIFKQSLTHNLLPPAGGVLAGVGHPFEYHTPLSDLQAGWRLILCSSPPPPKEETCRPSRKRIVTGTLIPNIMTIGRFDSSWWETDRTSLRSFLQFNNPLFTGHLARERECDSLYLSTSRRSARHSNVAGPRSVDVRPYMPHARARALSLATTCGGRRYSSQGRAGPRK